MVRLEGMKMDAGAKTNTLFTWRNNLEIWSSYSTTRRQIRAEEGPRLLHPFTCFDLLEQLPTQHHVITVLDYPLGVCFITKRIITMNIAIICSIIVALLQTIFQSPERVITTSH
jgi:hypothetical protein